MGTIEKNHTNDETDLDDRYLIPAWTLLYPLAGLAPARLHLWNVEHAVALLADELAPVPLQEIVRGPAYACGCGEGAKALLAALFPIVEGPPQADEREDDGEQDLQQLRRVRQGHADGHANIHTQQKSGSQNKCRLCGEEELSLDPVDLFTWGVLFKMPVRRSGEGNKGHQRRFEEEAPELDAEIEAERMPAATQNQPEQNGEQA